MTDDQELLAKIGSLAGKINRHKSQQQPGAQPIASHRPSHHRENAYRHGAGHANHYRVGRHPGPHRHRTLVMNNTPSGTNTPTAATASDNQNLSADDSASASPAPSSWVSKNARHRQLINSAIYDKVNQDRTKAIEATRKQQLVEQNARETAKLSSHFQQRGIPGGRAASTNPPAAGNHEVEIQGVRFLVTQRGRKLVKVPGDPNPPSATPKTAFVGGVKFHRSRNGNLYRDGVLKAQRHTGVKKVNEPCRTFSLTGTCAKGPQCRYIHDASKVAACRDYLQKRQCSNGDSCDLSHDLTPQRTPTCLHFAKGNCANSQCPYTHSHVSPGALVCRAFGIYGYCGQGEQCTERHVWECPDFSNTGRCKTKGCKLLHRERASVLRNRQQGQTSGEGEDGEEEEDFSSDQESVHSDDVDSDEVEEFLGDAVLDDEDFKEQRDFIAL